MPITTTPSGGPQGEFSTYTPIYAQTLSSAQSSITFSNIPTTFTDLVIVSSDITTSSGGGFISLRFNGDSGSNYSNTYMTGNNATATSGRNAGTVMYIIGDTDITNKTMGISYIQSYSNPNIYKQVLSRCGYSIPSVQVMTHTWRNTSPITSITLYGNGNINSGSSFTLYGIKAAAPAPKATGGDVITTDGTYWYHAFKTTGLFDVKTAITADVLVVAGGGSGGARNGTAGAGGGGGGAGGLRLLASQSLTASTSYTATIGAGGVTLNTADTYTRGGSGSNSSFAGTGITTISTTGGGGGGITGLTVLTGGSGGGAGGGSGSNNIGAAGNAGGYSPVEGYAGGNGNTDNSGSGVPYPAGGGGGAGGAGANFSGSTPGVGGAGASSYNSISFSTWLSATVTGVGGVLAKGGDGGTWVSPSGNASSGSANTGSGGNGGGTGNGGFGGSGIVIVRYPI